MTGWHRAKNEASLLPHYCRTCEQEFLSINDRESAHLLTLSHYIREHDKARKFVRCNKDCELRAQPEEITAGHRMYGPGTPKNTSTKTYAELFPEDD